MMVKKEKILLIFILCVCFYLLYVFLKPTYQPEVSYDKNYKCPSCNVILITMDALRADHLTPYGYPKDTSPFLNELSNKSWLYINTVSQSGSTVISISSLFTSKFPYTDRILTPIFIWNDTYEKLKENEETLPELLEKNGYYTKAIVSNTHTKSIFGFSKGFNEFDDNFDFRRRANETTGLAIDWLKNNDKKPFFLWVHYLEPHSPYDPPEPYIDKFYEPFFGDVKYNIYTIYGKESNISNEMVHNLSIAYDGNIRFMDDNLKILFEYLNNSGLLNNSFIIITADHGESLGEHFIFDHNDLYYGIIHVPLILKHPKLEPKIITQSVSLIDIFPTIVDVLDIKFNHTIRGRSLFSSNSINESQFAEYEDSCTFIKDEWKLIRRCKECPTSNLIQNFERLFNIKVDANEITDLKLNKTNIYENLRGNLDNLLNTSLSTPKNLKQNISNISDKELIEKLKQLGYVN